MKALRFGLPAVILGLFMACFFVAPARALDVPPAPTDMPVVDQTNTLTTDQKNSLAQQIAAERQASGNQIAVLMIPSLSGDSLEDYSIRVARAWGIGTKAHDNGVLLLVVKNDHLLRIEVGYGLEGALTDIQSNHIIRNDITPAFRQGKYYEGIQVGLTDIIKAIHGEYKAPASQPVDMANFPWEPVLFFGFIIFSWIGSILARSKSWWAGGVIGGVTGGIGGILLGSLIWGAIGVVGLAIIGLIFDKVVSSNYTSRTSRGVRPSWWAGGPYLGGGGRSGGGGFGGFGGGGFGGGGSSGSW